MNGQPVVLFAADTDRTQDFVFESSRLPEIRGGSQMLDGLNRKAADLVAQAGGDMIISSGGRLLALVPQSQAEQLQNKIEQLYPQESKAATTTVAYRPVTEDMLQNGYPLNQEAPFGSLMSWVGTWLQRKKNGRDLIPWLDLWPHAERCSSCFKRPVDPDRSFSHRPLCSVCRQKHDAATQSYWFNRYKDHAAKQGMDVPATLKEPHDLQEIGRACKARSGYVAMIYLDGDEMGQAFAHVDTPETTRKLSQAIEKTAEEAVLDALDMVKPTWLKPSTTRQDTQDQLTADDLDDQGRTLVLPVEILTIGGDDIILIVPADCAIPLACAISKQFQENIHDQLDHDEIPKPIRTHPYTLSGGVVIADDHNPVRSLRDLAIELKKMAKVARHHFQASEGYLDFQVLLGTDIPDRSLSEMRKSYPFRLDQPGHLPLSLLGRPYPVSRLQAVWEQLTHLRAQGFANSQMTQLTDALTKGVQQSGLFYQYQRQRLAKDSFDHLEKALQILHQSDPEEEISLWNAPRAFPSTQYRQQIAAWTALWDIAELYTLIQPIQGGRL